MATRTRGKQLDTRAAAAKAGIAPGSIQRLRYRDRKEPRTYPAGHERAGKAWPRFPEPDGYVGNVPWWYESTLESHLAELRGPGRPPAPPKES